MQGAPEPSTVIPFGPFEADLHAQELRKHGVRLRLPRQSFQILKMLLEKPGELVSREEMRAALWPADTFVDFEHGLNAAINRLREALGDDADKPTYVETLPRRGYRFVVKIARPNAVRSAAAAEETKEEEPVHEKPKQGRRLSLIAVSFAGLIVLIVVAFHWYRSVNRQPRVLAYRQLTSDRQQKGETACGMYSFAVTDGPRIFFSEPGATVAQVASTGGDTVGLSTPFSCFYIFDISPDKSELIGMSRTNDYFPDQPLWSLSVASGLAHRLGNLNGHAAAWSPDGQKFAYATGNSHDGPNDLCIGSRDGNEARKLLTIPNGFIEVIRWSPDGTVLRMNISGELWEATAQGNNLHKIVLFRDRYRSLGAMNWTGDGRYFVFGASTPHSKSSDLWLLKESGSFFGRTRHEPLQLSTGATSFAAPTPAPDSKHIFAVGGQYRGELLRFDLRTSKQEPFLGGISADQLDFSRDGRWVAYVSFPEGTLWRSRIDGSERMQLSASSFIAALPHWSPDGTRIAFSGAFPGQPLKIYVVSADGGKPEMVSESQEDQQDATWMPDGNSLVFAGHLHSAAPRLTSVDLRTRQLSIVPGSEGLFSPRVSPDGRFIVALDDSGMKTVHLFDRASQKWSELMVTEKPGPGWEQWSADSQSLYVTDFSDFRSPVLYRIHLPEGRIERIATLKIPDGVTGYWISWAAVTPDGSPLILRNLSMWEIYSLDVDLP